MLSVLAFHTGAPFAQGGFVGVDVFFVVSGFLITSLLLRDIDSGESAGRGLMGFYARRARRILPASLVVIAATLLGAVVFENAVATYRAVGDARSALLFSANLHFVDWLGYFGPQAPSLFNHYWTLSLEEQFYALWPLVMFAIAYLVPAAARRRWFLGTIAFICAGSFALNIAWAFDTGWHSANPSRAFYLLPTRAWQLGIGALVAIVAPRLMHIDRRARAALAPLGLIAIAVSVVAFDNVTFPGWAALVPSLGALAVVVAGIGAPLDGPIGRALSSSPAQRVGLYSYSLYLWHWPVLLLVVPRIDAFGSSWPARLALTTLISVPLSALTYHLVENPIRYARVLRVNTTRTVTFAVATIALFAVAMPLLQQREQNTVQVNRAVVAAATQTPTTGIEVKPESVTPFVPTNLEPKLTTAGNIRYLDRTFASECTASEDHPCVALLGDSHAEHIAASLDAAARAVGGSLTAYMRPACGWFGMPASNGRIGAQCNDFVRDALAKIAANPPSIVVLSGHADWAQAPYVQEWEDHVVATLAALPKTSRVLVVSQTPLGVDGPDCLADNLNNTAACNRIWPTEFNAFQQDLVTKHGAEYLDLRPLLCLSTVCPPVIGNTLVWADRHHLTAEFAQTLSPWFADQLRGVSRETAPVIDVPIPSSPIE